MDTDVIIVGGGLNGCTMALALAQQGRKVTLLDAVGADTHAKNQFDGRAYAIALGSQRMLAALGLWETLEADAGPMLDIKVTDGRVGQGPGPMFLHFDHAEVGSDPMGWMVEDRHLRRALHDAVSRTDAITHLTNQAVTAQSVTAHDAQVTTADGRHFRAALMIGCDGRNSGTATRAGIKKTRKSYSQTSLVCALEHERPHGGIAHQFFVPAGPVAILPLAGNRSSIVWTEQADQAARINALPDYGYVAALRGRIGDLLGDFKLAGDRYTYPLGYSLADRFIGPRTALVGDSAHAMHPIAGQGLNVGLRDVAALAHVLAEAHRRGQDPGSAAVLEAYQTWRRFDAALLVASTDGFNQLFSNDNAALRGLRGLGMGAVMRAPALKRAFIRQASGVSGDLPDLMRG